MLTAAPDPWEVAARQFEPPRDADPVEWSAKLDEYWWGQQRDIAQSCVENRYTAVQSCHDAGKSFIASRLIAWWIDSHPVGDAFVVTTAPSAAQVSAILWREVARAHKKGALPGRILSASYPQWKIGPELIGYGRKPADYDQSAFQGIHARYVLIIIDEACGVNKNLFDAVDALATNEYARVVAIGNPDDPSSHFARVCQPDSGWNVIRIDGLRTPNMTRAEIESGKYPLLHQLFKEEKIPYNDEAVPDDLRPMLLSPLWVEERLARWVSKSSSAPISQRSAQSSLFTSKVRGLFPDTNSEGVIPLGWVERAIERWRDWDAAGRPTPIGRRVVGADIARTGDDETALAIREGDIVIEVVKHPEADTMQATGYINALLGDRPHAMAVVDVIGVGAGVVDRMREQGRPVRPFNASGTAKGITDMSGEFKFRNLRAAAWWNLREMLDPSRGATLMLPDDDELRMDLTTPQWKVHSGGVIQIESKDDIKKRLGRSTDSGDAVVQSCWSSASPVGGDTTESDTLSWWDQPDDDGLSWNIEGAIG